MLDEFEVELFVLVDGSTEYTRGCISTICLDDDLLSLYVKMVPRVVAWSQTCRMFHANESVQTRPPGLAAWVFAEAVLREFPRPPW